jgi:hypothetical protein
VVDARDQLSMTMKAGGAMGEKCTSRFSSGGVRFECQLEFGHKYSHRWEIAWTEEQAADQLRLPRPEVEKP